MFYFFFAFIFFFPTSNIFCDEQDFEKKIEEFILNNPKIILQSLKNYSDSIAIKKTESDTSSSVEEYKEIILKESVTYIGNPDASKIVFEFFDYKCSYCLKAHMKIQEILEEDSDLKVILINFPILTNQSEELARLGIAIALLSNKHFLKFHEFALKNSYSLKEKKIKEFFSLQQLNYEEIKKKSEEEYIYSILKKETQIAKKLNLSGTPAFIIGNDILTGWIGKSTFIKLINQQ